MTDFNIQEKLDLFNSDKYKSYIEAIRTTSSDTLILNDDKIIIGNLQITKPKFMNIFEEIYELYSKKKKLLIEYYNVYNDIVFAKDNKIFKDQYTTIVDSILSIDNRIDKLHLYYEMVNKNDDILQKYRNTRNLYNNIYTNLDDDKIPELIKVYKDIHTLYEKIKDKEFMKNSICFYIIKLPEIAYVATVTEKKKKTINIPKKTIPEKTIPEKTIPKKPLIIKKKINVPKLSPEQKNKINNDIKELLERKFKFKTNDQCVSQKRSELFYMSKEDIIKEIDKDEELKNLFPKGVKYNKLAKKDLCNYLFI